MKKLAYCILLSATAFGVSACNDKTQATKDQPAPSSSVVATPPPSSSVASPVASGKASPVSGSAASWGGTYTLAAGTLSIPSDNKDYNGVKQVKDDPSKLMGDGKIDLAVAADGKVTGTIEGGAGPAVIDGSVVDSEIRGNVRRKDPKDDGLTGTITAKIGGDTAEGKLSLAEANAAIVREAKVLLKKK